LNSVTHFISQRDFLIEAVPPSLIACADEVIE
jgi:hypothetical protein